MICEPLWPKSTRQRSTPELRREKCREQRRALAREFLFEPGRAVALAARPRLGAVFVPAVFPRVRVLHREQLEKFLPIRPLLVERRGAKTNLHPARDAVGEQSRLLH